MNTLEGAIHGQGGDMMPQYLTPQDSQPQHRPSEEFSPPPQGETPRKRTYSAVSGGEFGSPFMAQRQSNSWGQQDPPKNMVHSGHMFNSSQAAPTGQMFREATYSPNGLQSQPTWRQPPAEVTRPQSNVYEGISHDPNYNDRMSESNEAIFEGYVYWNLTVDSMLISVRYYGTIHATYPILATTRAKMLARLVGCPATLREAFYEALHAAVRSYPSSTVYSSDPPSPRKAAQLVTLSEVERPSAQSFASSIIYLQTMLLLATEAQNRPPSTSAHDIRSRSSWLGSAVGVAYSMKLHLKKPFDKLAENDPDSDEKLGRRIWWSLVIMNRWHASSTASPSLIPDSSVVVYPEDQALLGDDLYHLARKCPAVEKEYPANVSPSRPVNHFGTYLCCRTCSCRCSYS